MKHLRWMAVAAAAVLSLPLAAEEDAAAVAREKAGESRARCITRLDGVRGVSSVNYAGSGTDYRLLIVVQNYFVKAAAREKIGGDAWEGMGIHWTVLSNQTVAAPAAPTTPPAPTKPEAPSTSTPSTEPDCDIVRAQLGLAPMRHPVGGTSWKSWVPCKVWLRSVNGPGGGHSYLHAKHRPGCVYQNGLVSPVVREGFLTPNEIRGSDVSWWRQVGQDLGNQFPPPAPPLQPKTGFYRRD